ncbi:MAG TPA: SDR family oxidoreductase [Gaiellales bacterium]|jgi:7-alpha-hydroxysteroid dehydrogenase
MTGIADHGDIFRLDGYAAIVTGAGRGIGAAIAESFAGAGADLTLVARTEADLDAVAARVRALGRSALVLPCDISDVSQAREVVAQTVAEYGRIDVLVNNAGGAAPADYLETTPEALDEAFHFNVSAAFELIKQATPHLLESGRASVINVTSRMDRQASRGMVVYGTVKAALTHLTHILSLELAPRVRVNGIAPGVVDTEALRRVLGDDLRADVVSATPLRRLTTVADVAATARFLASPAAGNISGKIIEVDGGAEVPTMPDHTPDLRPPSPV